MSDRPIQKGDLVMIVRGCCQEVIGVIFTVAAIEKIPLPNCQYCGNDHSGLFARATERYKLGSTHAPLFWLKRIDPGALSEDVPAHDEVAI